MASEAEEADNEDGMDGIGPVSASNGGPEKLDGREDAGSEEEEEEDEEPRLKYASLTKHLKPVYRNGDATSAFLIAGDKMVSQVSYTHGLGMKLMLLYPDYRNPQWQHSKR